MPSPGVRTALRNVIAPRSRPLVAFLVGVCAAAGGALWWSDRDGALPATTPAPTAAGSPLPLDDVTALSFDDFAAGMDATDPYRPPTPDERGTAVTALGSLLRRDAAEVARRQLAPLGFAVSTGTDASTGRRYALAISGADTERAWGAYLVDLSAPARLVIEVPHPRADLRTEQIGLALARAVPGSILLIAGAHRRAGGGAADVAHRTDSLFHAVSASLAALRLPQIQLHGFHDDSLPGTDVVLSAGAAQPDPIARRAGDGLASAGFAVCQAWQEKCGQLSGTRNVQGAVAAELGTAFLHVEIGRSVRDSDARRAGTVRALAGAVLG